MVCTLIDHRSDVKMFQAQVEPQALEERFHCKVLNISFCQKSISCLKTTGEFELKNRSHW